jgi:hypothetical protein
LAVKTDGDKEEMVVVDGGKKLRVLLEDAQLCCWNKQKWERRMSA